MSDFPNADNYRYQNFPFHASFMNYILKNASFDVKVKLAQVCKLFYHHYPDNIKILDTLEIKNNDDIISLPSFIHGCTANYFRSFADISINDLKFLAKAGTIKSLVISEIKDADGNIVPFENIVDSVPNADYIQ